MMWLDKIGHVDRVQHRLDVPIILKHRAVWRLWTNAGTALTLVVMYLSAAIGGGGGWPRGTPGQLHNDVYNSPYPKTRSFNKKLLTPLPGGREEVCSAKSKGAIFQESYLSELIFYLS